MLQVVGNILTVEDIFVPLAKLIIKIGKRANSMKQHLHIRCYIMRVKLPSSSSINGSELLGSAAL